MVRTHVERAPVADDCRSNDFFAHEISSFENAA